MVVRVFIACLGTETNTFSNLPTGWKTFEETMLFYGDATDNEPNTFSLPLHIWRKRSEERNYEVIESVAAFAQPGGKTLDSVYEELRDRVLSDLQSAGEVDIVLLSLHGAMTAESYEDCEGDLISCIRKIVGKEAIVAAELDLHCSITPTMVENSNFLITFKLYPHTDIGARAEEVFNLASNTALGAVAPRMSVLDCHMINKFRTSNPDMAKIVSHMEELEKEDGILSVSFAHGFPWQDVPFTTAKVLVVSDGNEQKGNAVAADLRDRIWTARNDLVQPTLSIDDALTSISEKPGLTIMADVADNAGGGAPSDSTFVLARALERGDKNLLIAYFWDPVAVRIAVEAGEGQEILIRVGGKTGPSSGLPVDLHCTIAGIKEEASQTFGDTKTPMGTAVWLRGHAGVDVVLTSKRTQVFHPDGMTCLGIDPAAYKGIVVKSSQHFYAGFEPIAEEIGYINAPGDIPPDFADIGFTNVSNPFWPKETGPFWQSEE